MTLAQPLLFCFLFRVAGVNGSGLQLGFFGAAPGEAFVRALPVDGGFVFAGLGALPMAAARSVSVSGPMRRSGGTVIPTCSRTAGLVRHRLLSIAEASVARKAKLQRLRRTDFSCCERRSVMR